MLLFLLVDSLGKWETRVLSDFQLHAIGFNLSSTQHTTNKSCWWHTKIELEMSRMASSKLKNLWFYMRKFKMSTTNATATEQKIQNVYKKWSPQKKSSDNNECAANNSAFIPLVCFVWMNMNVFVCVYDLPNGKYSIQFVHSIIHSNCVWVCVVHISLFFVCSYFKLNSCFLRFVEFILYCQCIKAENR